MSPAANLWRVFLPPVSDGRKTMPSCGAPLSRGREHSSATGVCSNGLAEAFPRDSVSFTPSIARLYINVSRRAGAHASIGS